MIKQEYLNMPLETFIRLARAEELLNDDTQPRLVKEESGEEHDNKKAQEVEVLLL